MAKLNNIIGQTFGNWYVIERAGSDNFGYAMWRCRCQLCGTEHVVRGYTLTNGSSTKCRACVPRETLSHPYKGDPITHIFSGMWQRCYDKSHVGYNRYGKQGICICDEWLNDRQKFYEWAYQNGYKPGLSIERIDIDGPYSPDNCKFIPLSEQSKNRSNCILVEMGGRTETLTTWCRELGLCRETIRDRIKRGMDPVEALTKPVNNTSHQM